MGDSYKRPRKMRNYKGFQDDFFSKIQHKIKFPRIQTWIRNKIGEQKTCLRREQYSRPSIRVGSFQAVLFLVRKKDRKNLRAVNLKYLH